MKFLTAIIGILPVLCMFSPVSAALRAGGGTTKASNETGRVSVSPSIGVTSASGIAAARRLPTLIKTGTSTTTTTSSSSSSSLMDEIDCVEKYTECIKASDVCDFNFEECTTTELFYAKKPQCNSVLLQCTSAGINTLFGTGNISDLATKNDQEQYMYPTAGSVLGQFIEAGAISNRLDTSSCVKRYTSCLHKDNVCGSDFELCTTNSEFKKQKIYCESTLARCQEDGIMELFGQTDTTRDPTSPSRLGVMISEGAGLAAVNAVSTCYKVADQCVLAACNANPYKCMESTSTVLSDIMDAINEGRQLTPEQAAAVADARTKQDVAKYIRAACFDTIGGNKYCHMTVNAGKIPASKDLIDEEERDNVYSDIIPSTMTRVSDKLEKTLDKFDKKVKDTCSDTLADCAMRTCGAGSGAACFKLVFGNNNSNCFGSGRSDLGASSSGSCSINAASTYNEIKYGCAAIVDTDANCQYAAASVTAKGYNYNYSDLDTFGILFPEDESDPIGVVTRLNATLKENYNDAAIAALESTCKNVIGDCIKTECGTPDFTRCYRNRNDILTDTYNTGQTKFDNSMNKVGGVLDFTIVRGLCVNTIKADQSCKSHFDIKFAETRAAPKSSTGWGGKSNVRQAWVDAVSDGYKAKEVEVDRYQDGCTPTSNRASGSGHGGSMSGAGSACDMTDVQECGTVKNGCVYNTPHYVSVKDYQTSMNIDTLVQEVLADYELQAQAEYNAKMTEEQNMCIAANEGSVMGKRDMTSSTYMWAKLKNRKVPSYYAASGLKATDFTASNDLYGSFCRARVTIESKDPYIQALIKESPDWAHAYFAVGDVAVCGSWLTESDLEQIAVTKACKKAQDEGKIERTFNCDSADKNTINKIKLSTGQSWLVGLSTVGSAAVGVTAMEVLQSYTDLGGLLNTRSKNRNSCSTDLDSEISFWNSIAYNDCCVNGTPKGDTYSGQCAGGGEPCLANYTMTSSGKSIQKDGGGKSISGMTSMVAGGHAITKTQVDARKGQLEKARKDVCDADGSASMWGRAGMDVLAGAALGTAGYFASNRLMKEGNRQQFSADEQAFMDEITSKIDCYVGQERKGTYGSVMEISLD